MNSSSWGPRKHRLAVSEPPSLTLRGRICALWPRRRSQSNCQRGPARGLRRRSRNAGRAARLPDEACWCATAILACGERSTRVRWRGQHKYCTHVPVWQQPDGLGGVRTGGGEYDSTDLAENGRVLPGGGRRAHTSRPSASRRVVAERSPNHVSSARAHSTAAGCNSTADRACGM